MRSERESDTKVLRALSPAIDSAVTLARKRVGAPFAGTDVENLQLLEHTPGSFRVVSLGQLMLSQNPLRPASRDGEFASTDHLARGTYRRQKSHYQATAQAPSAATLDLLKHLQSPEAMEMLGSHAFVPLQP